MAKRSGWRRRSTTARWTTSARIYLTLDGIRLAEKRGLGELMKQNYAALPAPKERAPWEILCVQPNAAPEVVEASYRALAKKAHPDAGGRAEDFRELQEAYEAMRR